jgi:hypothetical protein
MDTQTFQNIILLLSLTPIALLGVIFFLILKLKDLKIKIGDLNTQLNKQQEKQKSFLKFYIGSKALLNDFGLEHTDSTTNKKTSFTVDYEVEIVDISETQIKVRAVNFNGNDAWSRDPQHKQGIIAFMQDKWVSKKDAQLIMDEAHNRQVKLEELGI